MTVANPSNYWISSNALRITLNANGDADYIQGNTASGAMILCYIKNVDGLGYDAGHNYRRWKLLLSPTYFPTKSAKYVYVKIPRPTAKVPQDYAVVVFPSQIIDVYGKNASEQQIGSTDYYYIWLQGIISASEVGGVLRDRVWTELIQTGTLASDEAYDAGGDNTWWRYSSVNNLVTFLKGIVMDVDSWFENIRLGHDRKNIVGVANDATEETNDDRLVTPKQVLRLTKDRYLNSDEEDVAHEQIGFLKGLWIKAKGMFGFDEDGNMKANDIEAAGDADILGKLGVKGDATVDGILKALAKIISNNIQSDNYNGDGAFDTGFQLQKGGDGITKLVVDNLFVRMKAIFNELEIRKISYAGGNIIFSHAGSKIVYVTKVYEDGSEYQEYIIVMDDDAYLNNRGVFNVDGYLESGGVYLEGAHLEPNPVPPPPDSKVIAYRCYLMKDDGTTATENWWKVDDQARCQTFNVVDQGTYQNAENTFYWRLVRAVGSARLSDGKMYDYVELSKEDRYHTGQFDSDIPKAGDNIVQMGNRTDSERQGFISIEVYGEYAPGFKVYKGVNSYSLDDKRKICLSPKLSEVRAQKLITETEYDVCRVPQQRSTPWHEGMQCYYYDLVQHNGASWYCVYPESGIGGVMYTTEEPSENATYWRPYAQKGAKGDKGDSVSYDAEHSSMGYAYSTMGTPEQGRDYPSDITSWSETIPAPQKGKYLWTKDVTAYNNAGTLVYTTTYGVTYEPNDGDSVEIDSSRTFIKYCRQTKEQYTGQHPADNQFSTTYPSSLGQGDYLWILNQLAYVGVANPLKSYSVSMLGTDGSKGDRGADGYTTHFAYATSADGSQGFSTSSFDGATYIGTYRDQNAADSTDYHDYTWTRWRGVDGTSITKNSEVTEYVLSEDGVNPKSGETWSETKPTPAQGEYVLIRTTITWSDGTTTVLPNVERNPNDGQAGQSITITNQSVKYSKQTSGDVDPTTITNWGSYPSTLSKGDWLYSKTTVTYSDGTHTDSYGVTYIGVDGEARGITQITEYYKATNSNTPLPAPTSDTGWSTDPNLSDLTDKWDENHIYLWNYEKVTYNKAPLIERTVPQIVAIWTKDGDAGRGIDSITNKYKVTNTNVAPAREHEGGTGWSTSPTAPGQGEYLWNYEIIAWTSGTTPTYTDVQQIGYSGTDGDSITKSSETPYYIKNTTGVRPAENDPNWNTTKPTLGQGEWLFTKTDILWSDGSHTYLYTDERNPKDGEDIVAGETTVQYAVSTSNTTQPSTWYDYADIVSQIEPGKWLWMKSTTPYYKGSTSGASAGSSTNYTVSYIGTNGTNGRALTASSEHYKASDKDGSTGHQESAPAGTEQDPDWSTNPNVNNWNENNRYLWNYEKITYTNSDGSTSIERTVPKIIAIWTKDGEKGKGIDHITNYYAINNDPLHAPATSAWDDTAMAPTAESPFLWNYEVITFTDGTSTGSIADAHIIGHYGINGKNTANCFVEQQNVLVNTDKNGNVIDDFQTEVFFYVIAGSSVLGTVSAEISEDGSVDYAVLGGAGIFDPTNHQMTREGTGVSIEGAYFDPTTRGVVLPADLTYSPSSVVITVPKNTTLDEHQVLINITARDDEGNDYTCLGAIQIKKQVQGKDGQSTFKSIVFKRSNTNPGTPTGGSYASPVPEGWSDGIPEGSAKVWESTRIFTNDGETPQQSVWTAPREMTDTQTYDVEFAFEQTNDAQPAAPVDGESGNRHGCVPASNQIWFDPVLDATLPSGKSWEDMVWRAERETNNGVQGEWAISRIKAEHTVEYAIVGPDVVKPGDTTMTISIRKTVDGSATTDTPSAMGGTLTIAGGGSVNQNTGVVTLPTITASTVLTLTYTVNSQPRSTKVVRGVADGINGTGVIIKGNAVTTDILDPNWRNNVLQGIVLLNSGNDSVAEWDEEDEEWDYYDASIGDCYIVTENKHLYEMQVDGWHDLGKFNGDDGKNAVNIIVSPASLIVNQDLNNTDNLQSLAEQFIIQVKVGEALRTVNSIAFTAEVDSATDHYKALFTNNGTPNPSGIGSVNGNILTLKGIGYTQTTVEGRTVNVYYDSAYVDCVVTYATNKTINTRIKIYANLLGTWKRTVEAGEERIAAQKVSYALNNGDDTKTIEQSKATFNSVRSAAESYEEWARVDNTSAGSKTYINTHLATAEGNISTVSKQVTNGKNMLSGVLDGNGWRGATASITPHSITGDVINNWIPRIGDDIYIVSPNVSVEKDTAYTLSFDVPVDESGSITVLVYNTSLQLLFTLSTNASGRRKVSFTPTANADIMLYIAASEIHYPQLEIGSVATPFDASTTAVVTEIKQTADEIDASIRTDLRTTGVNITDGLINLLADKVLMKSSAGQKMISFEYYQGIPSLVFYDTTGTQRMWVLNYHGLLSVYSTNVQQSWSNVYIVPFASSKGQLTPFDPVSPATERMVYARYLFYMGATEEEILDDDIAHKIYETKTAYQYNAGYYRQDGEIHFTPNDSAGGYDGRVYMDDAVVSDDYKLPASDNHVLAGYYFGTRNVINGRSYTILYQYANGVPTEIGQIVTYYTVTYNPTTHQPEPSTYEYFIESATGGIEIGEDQNGDYIVIPGNNNNN